MMKINKNQVLAPKNSFLRDFHSFYKAHSLCSRSVCSRPRCAVKMTETAKEAFTCLISAT